MGAAAKPSPKTARPARAPRAPARARGFFEGAFDDHGLDPALLIGWNERSGQVGAKRLAPAKGAALLRAAWAGDRLMKRLTGPQLARLEQYFLFVSVPQQQDVVRQGEFGNFMLVLLDGTVAVERVQPWGEELQLAEVKPGDILGEMSLLDSGSRFSKCRTLSRCEFAVLHAHALDEMLANDPALAASLIALLARMLSLRLRAVSARLTGSRDA